MKLAQGASCVRVQDKEHGLCVVVWLRLRQILVAQALCKHSGRSLVEA
jgi:hypothetical protein